MTIANENAIKRPARKAASAVHAAPSIALTKDENILLDHYRTMDARRKGMVLSITEAWAKKRPHHAAPVLRLIVGGAA